MDGIPQLSCTDQIYLGPQNFTRESSTDTAIEVVNNVYDQQFDPHRTKHQIIDCDDTTQIQRTNFHSTHAHANDKLVKSQSLASLESRSIDDYRNDHKVYRMTGIPFDTDFHLTSTNERLDHESQIHPISVNFEGLSDSDSLSFRSLNSSITLSACHKPHQNEMASFPIGSDDSLKTGVLASLEATEDKNPNHCRECSEVQFHWNSPSQQSFDRTPISLSPYASSLSNEEEQISSWGDTCSDCGCDRSTQSTILSRSEILSRKPVEQPSSPKEELLNPLTMENSELGETIRWMRYRAFLRWYKGVHERGWSRAATGIFCLLAGTLMIFSYYSMCSFYVLRSEAILIYIGVLLFLSLVLAFFSYALFVPRYSVRISLVFIVIAIGLVVVINFRQGWSWNSAGKTFSEKTPGMVSVFDLPQFQDSPQFQQRVQAAAAKVSASVGCPIKQSQQQQLVQEPLDSPPNKVTTSSESVIRVPLSETSWYPLPEDSCVIYKWFPYSFFIAQGSVFLLGLFYSFVLDRIAEYYYLKSPWFIAQWRIVRCCTVELLVPALGQSDRKRYDELLRFDTMIKPLREKKKGINLASRLRPNLGDQRKTIRRPVIAKAERKLLIPSSRSNQTSEHYRTQSTVASSLSPFPAEIIKEPQDDDKDKSVFGRIDGEQSLQLAINLNGASKKPKQTANDHKNLSGNNHVDVDRVNVVQGLRIEFSFYSAWRVRLRKVYYFLCCCWCSRRAKIDEESLMTPEKVGCWRRRPKKKFEKNEDNELKNQGKATSHKKHHAMKAYFIGEIDSNGRPDGFGYWKDDCFEYGERLFGYWSTGFPNGPHKSREVGTGSGLMCIRIGWARLLTDNLLKFGVANVECSVSGKFYREFPHVELLFPPEKLHAGQGLFRAAKTGFDEMRLRENFPAKRLDVHKGNKRAQSVNELASISVSAVGVKPNPRFISDLDIDISATSSIANDQATERSQANPEEKRIRMNKEGLKLMSFDIQTNDTTKQNQDVRQMISYQHHSSIPPESFNSPWVPNSSEYSLISHQHQPLESNLPLQQIPAEMTRLFGDRSIIIENGFHNDTDTPHQISINQSVFRNPQLLSSPFFKPTQTLTFDIPCRDQDYRQFQETASLGSSTTGLKKSCSVSLPERDVSWYRQRAASEKEGPFRRFARYMPQQIKAGAAEAGAAVWRRLRRREIEHFARLEKSRRDIAWCLAELSPHTPNFGIQPRSELVITVDYERGLYISGYIPIDKVEQEKNLPSLVEESTEDRLGVIPELFVRSCLEAATRKNQMEPGVPTIMSEVKQTADIDQGLRKAIDNGRIEGTKGSPIHEIKSNGRIEGTKGSPIHEIKSNGRKIFENLKDEKCFSNPSPALGFIGIGNTDIGDITQIEPSDVDHSSLFRSQNRETSSHGSERMIQSPSLVKGLNFQESNTTHNSKMVELKKQTVLSESYLHGKVISSPYSERLEKTSQDLITDDEPLGPETSTQLDDRIVYRTNTMGIQRDKLEKRPGLLKSRHTVAEFRTSPKQYNGTQNAMATTHRGLKLPWSLSPGFLFGGGEEKKKNRKTKRAVITDYCSISVIPYTVEESAVEMAAVGHTPFYRRPTIEKDVHKPGIQEMKIRVVKRRLLSAPRSPRESPDPIVYKPPDSEILTRTCTCTCHHEESMITVENDEESKYQSRTGQRIPPSIKYEPDSNITNLDPWDGRFGLETAELEADGWTCLDTAGSPEVLVYIHGFNNSHQASLQILGQMAAFGNYPNHIRLFIFSWPSGSGFWDFFKAIKTAEDSQTHQALADFLTALRDNGIRQIHIMCHSMGSRLFLKSFRAMKDSLFQKCETNDRDYHSNSKSPDGSSSPGKRAHGKMQLVTVTFLNPEYFLDEFVEEDYLILRSFCNHISIFADVKDQALWWSETLSRRPALGKTVFGLWRRVRENDFSSKGAEADLIEKAPIRFMNTVSFFNYKSGDVPRTNRFIGAPSFSTSESEVWQTDGRREVESSVEWLDLDVIDTTFVDQNVHAMRHSFWSLNREIIEDIRELMVTRKRARQRMGRLDRRDGNVWVYRVAPAFLTSLFEFSF